MNGKGDKPRNCFSKTYKSNYDEINWNTSSESQFKDSKETNGKDKRNLQDVRATQQGRKET
jgi:triacylglycerol esterase/lipase EstA (alpha/beta hydrolase family)